MTGGDKRIPTGAFIFLLFIAVMADGTKALLDLLFGIGIIIDPLFISPITTGIFWITLNHNGVPMFSGKNAAAGWTNEIISLTPGIDIVPDWTTYTIILMAKDRIAHIGTGT